MTGANMMATISPTITKTGTTTSATGAATTIRAIAPTPIRRPDISLTRQKPNLNGSRIRPETSLRSRAATPTTRTAPNKMPSSILGFLRHDSASCCETRLEKVRKRKKAHRSQIRVPSCSRSGQVSLSFRRMTGWHENLVRPRIRTRTIPTGGGIGRGTWWGWGLKYST
jgi:hypothetical protein